MDDAAEFRAAVTAYLRAAVDPAIKQSEQEFEAVVEVVTNRGIGGIAQIFRTFHTLHGRYPTFDEICPPGTPRIGIAPQR